MTASDHAPTPFENILRERGHPYMRLVDPVQNPGLLDVPAIRRLIGHPDATLVHPSIARRAATLAAQRRTPLDLDQEKALATACGGADIVVQGPPGAGKTEALAEIARAALEDGRRVLVASTVPSALEVARRRLAATGHVERYADRLAFETPATFAERPFNEPLFDLLIVDEATQMTVSEAIMIASRARQILVFGDHRQLGAPDGRPNLYDHARRLGFAEVMLKKHYRSRVGSLILFSNIAAYGCALRVTPRPEFPGDCGVSLALSKKAVLQPTPHGLSNITEAGHIADRLAALAAAGERRSIGVIAATPGQATAIRAAMATRGLDDRQFSQNPDEPFFIRTMTQVQGEERDIAIVSLVYAPRNGTVSGALGVFQNKSQPIERLNVALSRARHRTEVFASFPPGDIRRSTSEMSAAGKGLSLMFLAFQAAFLSAEGLPVDKAVEAGARDIRRPGDRLDNLGVLHGWARPGSNRYNLGIVVRYSQTPGAIWDEAIAQLTVAGWNLAVIDPTAFLSDLDGVRETIERAAR